MEDDLNNAHDWTLKISKDGNTAIEFDADACIVDPTYLSDADEQSSADTVDLPHLNFANPEDEEKTILAAEQSTLDTDYDLERKALELLCSADRQLSSDIAKSQLHNAAAAMDSLKMTGTPGTSPVIKSMEEWKDEIRTPLSKKKRKRSKVLKCFSIVQTAIFPTTPILPTRGTSESAGLDLYAVDAVINLTAGSLNFLPTGLSFEIPKGHYGQIACRSSLAVRGITVSGGIIDSDYRGEILVMLFNHGKEDVQIYQGQKFAQLLIIPYTKMKPELVEQLSKTERGDGGFGSTDIPMQEEIKKKEQEEVEKEVELEKANLQHEIEKWIEVDRIVRERQEKEKLERQVCSNHCTGL